MKNLFQLLDSDEDQTGLILTNATTEQATAAYHEYYNEKIPDEIKITLSQTDYDSMFDNIGADGFEEYLIIKGFEAERVYTVELVP